MGWDSNVLGLVLETTLLFSTYVDNINDDTTDTRSFFRSVYEGIIILIFNWVFIEISMIWK
jgi:hypothetical protein